LFVKGGAPLVVERVNYLRDPEFQGRAAPNPWYAAPAASSVTSAGGTPGCLSEGAPIEPVPAEERASAGAPE
jgi:hypothetical protein